MRTFSNMIWKEILNELNFFNKKRILTDNHYKIFKDQSEFCELPTQCNVVM